MTEPETVALELLTLAPSSFAALYGYVRRQSTQQVSVDDLWDMVERWEVKGLVRVRLTRPDGVAVRPTRAEREQCARDYRGWLGSRSLGELTVDAMSVDEVGLWIEKEPHGRLDSD